MVKRRFSNSSALIVVLLVGVIAALFYSGTWTRMMSMGPMGRHHQGMMGGLPAEYSGRRNPLPVTEKLVRAGERLYQIYCAVCHGERGYGDGPTARDLNPPPANLYRLMRMPVARDDYLFWTISEGGKAFNSSMPAFKESLSIEERWKIIHYLRQF